MRPLQFSGAITVHSDRIANQTYFMREDCPPEKRAAKQEAVRQQRVTACEVIKDNILRNLATVFDVPLERLKKSGVFQWCDSSGKQHQGFVGVAPNNENVTITTGVGKNDKDQMLIDNVVTPALNENSQIWKKEEDVALQTEGPVGAFHVIQDEGEFKLGGVITEFDPHDGQAVLTLFNAPESPGQPIVNGDREIKYNFFRGIPRMLGGPTSSIVRKIVNVIYDKLPENQGFGSAAE